MDSSSELRAGERSSREVTDLLLAWREGDRIALDRLMPLVYDELHRLARGYLRREQVGHTLQPTALVHEAFLRMIDQQRFRYENRAHFFAIAANLMRGILVNHAVRRQRPKHGGRETTLTLQDADGFF